MNEGDLTRLAESGAFSSFDPNRRSSLWTVRGVARAPRSDLEIAEQERIPAFQNLDAFETISWDYAVSRHSPRGHPLAPLREQLVAQKLPDAAAVRRMPDGRRVRYAGLVICRQRPGTASGVVFMTLEDETGFVNVVVWSQVFEEHAVAIKTTNFLGVTGKLQVKDDVTHLIADAFWQPQVDARPQDAGSRDFH